MEIDLDRAAEMLGMSAAMLSRWIRQGKIPAVPRGGSYVLQRGELEHWARRRGIPLVPGKGPAILPEEPERPGIARAVERGGVIPALGGKDIEGVLRALVDAMPAVPGIDREDLLRRLVERERLVSTGIGSGVALPHPRFPEEASPPGGLIVTGFLETEVDFQAVDGRPVFALFLMLSPDTKMHLWLLSRLSFCLRDRTFLAFLEERPARDALLERVRMLEEKLDRGDLLDRD